MKKYNFLNITRKEVADVRLTTEAKEYLSESIDAVKSEILVSDLDKVLFSANQSAKNTFVNRALSPQLKELIYSWKSKGPEAEELIVEPAECIDIIPNDSYKYTSQIFLPIYQENELVGVFMHFTDNRRYIWSNLRNAKTLRHFTELLTSGDFI